MAESDKKRLGLEQSITRRDFLSGSLRVSTAATAASAMGRLGCREAPTGSEASGSRESGAMPSEIAEQSFEVDSNWYGPGGIGEYADSHGNTPEVLEIAHQVREGLFDAAASESVDTGEDYDLVIVGGGFTGLAAALRFRELRPDGRVLVFDNHPIFGGEAKRNEMEVDGVRIFAPQGSNDFGVLPKTGGPEDYFTRLGMPRAFSYREPTGKASGLRIPMDNYSFMHWKSSAFDVGYFFGDAGELISKNLEGVRPAPSLLRSATKHGWHNDPWKSEGLFSRELGESIRSWRNGLATDHRDADPDSAEFRRWLDSMTMKDYYENVLGVPPEVTATVSPILASIIGLGCDAISAWWGWHFQLPGFRLDSRYDEVTFDCFPGGNTGIARYFLKALIPSSLPGDDLESVLLTPIDFSTLDRSDSPVRFRHRSTVVRVAHEGALARSERVRITYRDPEGVKQVRAKAVVMAAGGWMNRRVLPDLPASHHEAYGGFHHSSCLVANVALRRWSFLAKLGVAAGIWDGGFGFSANIRRPMILGSGAQSPPLDPDQPIMMTFYVPQFAPGIPAKAQGQAGRVELLTTSFAEYEHRIREQMVLLFGDAGFDPATDIAGIILNRWGHAYVNPGPGFMFGSESAPAPSSVLRKPFGRVTIAHSELRGHQNWTGACAEGREAVERLTLAQLL